MISEHYQAEMERDYITEALCHAGGITAGNGGAAQ
jgi:hypothetical protein